MGNIPQSNEPCHSSLSYVFRVLWNSFSYPRDACITHSQTVLALNPKNIRALTVLFNGAGWFLKLLLLSIFHSKRLLSKTTALSKSQATAAERRGKECECFLTRCKRGQTCASRDCQGKVADKRTTNEGYFRLRKFVSRGESDWFCLCCAFCTLLGAKRVDRNKSQ